MTHRHILILLVATGCASEVSLGGPNTLVRVDSEPNGVNCPGGGLAINTGLDSDGDTFLDDGEITSTQYVCNGNTAVQCAGGSVVAGTIDLRSGGDFARLAGVHCIDGDLLIAGTTVDELPLADLETVTGDVVIAGNPELQSLDGLRNLREVGRRVHIQVNDSLTDVGALGSLRRCAEISIVGNDALTDLVGLEGFVNLNSAIAITSNASLRSLAGLDNLTTSSRSIVIHNNRSLVSVAALDNLRSVGALEISGNDALLGFSFANLEKVDVRLIVSANANLRTAEFSVVSTIGEFLRFESDPALISIRTPRLLTTGALFVNDNTSLATLEVPSLVFATASIELANLPHVTDLRFDALSSIGTSLVINATPILSGLGGFSSLGSIGGALQIDTTNLANFSGLGALKVVSGDMRISNNGQLQGFAGLSAIHEVGGDLTISGNPNLPGASAQSFANSITVHGTVTIN